jgi:hypothetical protein
MRRLLVNAQCDKPTVPQVGVFGPFDKLELPNQNRSQPQCRILDYAGSGIASAVITVFSVILFGIIQLIAGARTCKIHRARNCLASVFPLL